MARITEDEGQTPQIRVELIDEGSKIVERSHDLIVLSVGIVPGFNPTAQYGVTVAEDGFIENPSQNMAPALTRQEGIFAAGTATGPMDIVDTILTSGAVAAETAAYLKAQNGRHVPIPAVTTERSLAHA